MRLLTTLGAVAIVLAGCASATPPAATSTVPPATPGLTEASPTPSPSTPEPTQSSAPAAGTWTVTGSMSTPRAEFSATLLRDGRVLVAGGLATNAESGPDAVGLASAELYDPSTGKWTPTGSMHSPHAQHTATLLLDGRVLVSGGICPAPAGKPCPPLFSPELDPSGAVATAELYDPRNGKWSVTGTMTTPRARHTATLLADGMVLVAGAEHADDNFGWPEPFARGILASTELYDPSTGKWTATGSMITARTQQFAVKLEDGKVLMFGGCCPVSPTAHGDLASAEVYDPSTGKWTATGGLITGRAQGGTAALLGDGTVIVAGGDPGGVADGDPMLASAEMYDPSRGTWSATTGMNGPRVESSSTLLANGRVFVVGGFAEPGVVDGLLASAELFDPNTRSWIGAGSMSITRFDFTATLLANGQVLATGGLLPDGVASSAELYDPGPGN